MMKHEFEELTGKKVCNATYDMWERMYMASNMTKQAFCKMVKKSVVADAYKDDCEEELRELKIARDNMLGHWGDTNYRDYADDYFFTLHNIETRACISERCYEFYKENGPKYGTFISEHDDNESWEHYKEWSSAKNDPAIWGGFHKSWTLIDLYQDAKGVWRYKFDNSRYERI